MPLNLMPGESPLWASNVGRSVGGWTRVEDAYAVVTTYRLVLTYSDGADRGTRYLPLEKIDSVNQTSTRKDFTKGWLIAIIIGLLACVIPGIIIFLLWFFSRENSLVFTAGGGRLVMYNELLGRGGGARQEDLIDMVESARQNLVHQPPPSAPVRVTLNP